jgi:hypothetical protein
MKPETRTKQTEEKEEKSVSTAYLPYTQTTYVKLSRMLAKYQIKCVTIPPRKISSYIPPTKDPTGLRTPYPTAFPYGNCMVLHFYQQQESSTTKTIHKVINKRLKTYV